MFALGKEVKKVMKMQKVTLAMLAEEMGKRTGKQQTPSAVNYKFTNGSMTLVELIEICDILGYEVAVTPKEEGRGSYCLSISENLSLKCVPNAI